MALYRITGQQELSPSVHETAYVAESADVIGDVRLAENTSVWSHVTLRGDNEPITVGRARTSGNRRCFIPTSASL